MCDPASARQGSALPRQVGREPARASCSCRTPDLCEDRGGVLSQPAGFVLGGAVAVVQAVLKCGEALDDLGHLRCDGEQVGVAFRVEVSEVAFVMSNNQCHDTA